MGYDFSTLNDKEFEQLSRDLLNVKLNINFQDFKSGKDSGIDLRYSSTNNKNYIVAQAKHYAKSGYTQLKRALKKEVPNVVKLNPKRYIVVTSVNLSAKNKDEIVDIFSPYLLSANDVIGNEDMNAFLSENPEIEKSWFKLWLSSTAVLEAVLYNAAKGKSIFFEAEIKRRISLYVNIDRFSDAYDILRQNNYILITGQPGVGKTTLANLITYDLLAKGFELIYIDDDIKDAENIFSVDPTKKQLFYFDDFLGSNYFEIINPKTTESRFVNFLERVKRSPNKVLILTTRTTVLLNALTRYEKLNRTKIDLARKEIHLGEYSQLEKARILYNHLYHSSLALDYLDIVRSDKNYWKIIKHPNYNPRLVEFFTDKDNLSDIKPQKYIDFILSNLNNPEQIWSYAYKEQLTTEDRLLLHSIFTASKNDADTIQEIFNDFLYYEMTNYRHVPDLSPFKSASRKLLDGIIKQVRVVDTNTTAISFSNPSIRDFLIGYFLSNDEEKWKLIKGCTFIEQLEVINSNLYDFHRIKGDWVYECNRFINHLLQLDTSTLKTVEKCNDKYLLLRLSALLVRIPTIVEVGINVDSFVHTKVLSLSPYELSTISERHFKIIIGVERYDGLIYNWVHSNWDEIIETLSYKANDEDDFDFIKDLFKQWDLDFEYFIKYSDEGEGLRETIVQRVNELTKDWVYELKSSIYNSDDYEDMKSELSSNRKDWLHTYSLDDNDYSEKNYFDSSELEELILENKSRENPKWEKDDRNRPHHIDVEESNVIDDLFS